MSVNRSLVLAVLTTLSNAVVANASVISVSAASPVVDVDLDGDGFLDFRFAYESTVSQGNFFRVESPLWPPSPVVGSPLWPPQPIYPPQLVLPLPADPNFPVGNFDPTTSYTYNTLAVTSGDASRIQALGRVTLKANVETVPGTPDAGVPTILSAQDFSVSGDLSGVLAGNGGLIIPSDFSATSQFIAGTFFAGLDNPNCPTPEMVVFGVSFSPAGDEMDINSITVLPGTSISTPEPSALTLAALGFLGIFAWRRRHRGEGARRMERSVLLEGRPPPPDSR